MSGTKSGDNLFATSSSRFTLTISDGKYFLSTERQDSLLIKVSFPLISYYIPKFPNKDSEDLLLCFLFLVASRQDCLRTAKARNKTDLIILKSKSKSSNLIFRYSMWYVCEWNTIKHFFARCIRPSNSSLAKALVFHDQKTCSCILSSHFWNSLAVISLSHDRVHHREGKGKGEYPWKWKKRVKDLVMIPTTSLPLDTIPKLLKSEWKYIPTYPIFHFCPLSLQSSPKALWTPAAIELK